MKKYCVKYMEKVVSYEWRTVLVEADSEFNAIKEAKLGREIADYGTEPDRDGSIDVMEQYFDDTVEVEEEA